MTRYRPTSSDLRNRQCAQDIARAAGRLGLSRIPDEALFADGRDPSDTAVHRLLDAFEDGQRERGEP